MERLTKEEALQLCKKQWLWVAVTGKLKSQYLYEDNRPKFDCYACEYDAQNDHKFCRWGNCIVPWPGDGYCYSTASPYDTYRNADWDSEERKEAALAIAALCDEALEALHEERAFGHDLPKAL
jgi:hypothetical protein